MKRSASALLRSAGLVMLAAPCMLLARAVPRKRGLLVFGAWFGELFGDNPKYLALHLLEHTDARIVWIGNPEVGARLPAHPRLAFARRGSMRAAWALLRAKAWVFCQRAPLDLTALPLHGRALRMNLWHGIPLKYIGRNAPKNRARKRDPAVVRRLYEAMCGGPDWTSVSSPSMRTLIADDCPEMFSADRCIAAGMPRNDFLVANRTNENLRRTLKLRYASLLGFDPARKVVLYMPTYREAGNELFAFYGLPDDEQARVLGVLDEFGAVLLEKHHFQTYRSHPVARRNGCSVAIRGQSKADVDVQELLLIADILITDYSSAYFDFALMERPVLHFAYDLERYETADAGLAYDLREVAAGPILRTLGELLAELSSQLRAPEFRPAPGFRDLVEWEKGGACRRIAGFLRERGCL